ncbi:DUF5060 domain-containing protein [Aliifodinibius salicampi]|uniref:DUF5060 domain-containing protein n=1 Tax=Fodinibius salicampi TaxID=1920655 RepID=A0ABT3Q1C1_9BACT|nr:DUF5060 domain-containing protein [Fodinibius salicampi]MCW9713905.1 DUF5060 domain-containing protein [Fodinibius salicampi]
MGIRVSLLSILSIGLLLASCANQKSDQLQEIAQWGRWEYTLTAEEPVDQEIDLKLTVELTSPSGNTDQVPSFWDGDSL